MVRRLSLTLVLFLVILILAPHMTLGYTFISSKSSYLLQKTRGGPTSSHLLAINEGKGGGEGGIKGDEECRPVKFTSPGAGEDGREGPER